MTETLELGLVGAHMSGLALNGEIVALGGVLARSGETEPCYRLFALPGGPPQRPGLLRVAVGAGHAIALEVWRIPASRIGDLLAAIPAPLGLATLRLADGSRPKGFVVEAEGTRGAADISQHGGWRAFLASGDGAAPAPGRSELEAAFDATAALFGLTLRPEWRRGAVDNLAVIAARAADLATFPLDDEADTATPFHP